MIWLNGQPSLLPLSEPTCTTVPHGRVARMQLANAAWLPETSKQTSTWPRPWVSACNAAASRLRLMVIVAPTRAQTARGWSTISAAISALAPARRAAISTRAPTRPAPHPALAQQRAGLPDRVQRHRQRLAKSRDLVGERVGHGNALRGIEHHLLAHRTLHMRPFAGAAEEVDVFAMVGRAGAAETADTATARWIERHPLARLQALHLRAQFQHLAGSLVPRGQRRADDKVADPAMLVVVQVGAADTDRLDPHAHLVRSQRLGRPVGDAQIARAMDFAVAHAVLRVTSGFAWRGALRPSGPVACAGPRRAATPGRPAAPWPPPCR